MASLYGDYIGKKLDELHIDLLKHKYLKEKNVPERLYEFDIFGLVYFFEPFYKQHVHFMKKPLLTYYDGREAYLAILCGGITGQKVPTATELRLYCDFYDDVDFMRLLARQYDLENELQLNIKDMFEKYKKLSGQTVFQNYSKYGYLRVDDPNILKPRVVQCLKFL